MLREIQIYDATNKIYLTVNMDDEKEFLEIWGVSNGKQFVVERKIHGLPKSPIIISKQRCWSCGAEEGTKHEETCCGKKDYSSWEELDSEFILNPHPTMKTVHKI